jgi:serine/threonine protein phosphatase PrpC
MSVTLNAAVVSDLGLLRPNNEDAAFAGRRVIAVADGIGGGPAGEVASRIAIKALTEVDEQDDDPLQSLRRAVETANRTIKEATQADPAAEGMGTTLTALIISDGAAVMVHIGDSRAYLFRDGTLHQITRDDTYVQNLVDDGMITADQARHHPHKSVITASLQGRTYSARYSTVNTEPGDSFLLCSDGLSDIVTDEAIALVLRNAADPGAAAERLVKLALQAGAPDNVTVVVTDPI